MTLKELKERIAGLPDQTEIVFTTGYLEEHEGVYGDICRKARKIKPKLGKTINGQFLVQVRPVPDKEAKIVLVIA